MVLGVVVLGTVGFFAWLSSLYSPWKPRPETPYYRFVDGQGPLFMGKERRQRFPWLPGQNWVYVPLAEAEYLRLVELTKQ